MVLQLKHLLLQGWQSLGVHKEGIFVMVQIYCLGVKECCSADFHKSTGDTRNSYPPLGAYRRGEGGA